MTKIYKIFISHSWTYTDTLESLRKLLDSRGYFAATYEESTKDKPINSDDESYVKRSLAGKIANSDIVIGLAGMYASHSDWIAWELDKAIELKVPVIGVTPHGQERVSKVVSDRALEVVKWSTESIVRAVREHAK